MTCYQICNAMQWIMQEYFNQDAIAAASAAPNNSVYVGRLHPGLVILSRTLKGTGPVEVCRLLCSPIDATPGQITVVRTRKLAKSAYLLTARGGFAGICERKMASRDPLIGSGRPKSVGQ